MFPETLFCEMQLPVITKYAGKAVERGRQQHQFLEVPAYAVLGVEVRHHFISGGEEEETEAALEAVLAVVGCHVHRQGNIPGGHCRAEGALNCHLSGMCS